MGPPNSTKPPPPMEQVPLPIPKNLVLMTLIESAQESSFKLREKSKSSILYGLDDDDDDYDGLKPYESGDDDDDVDRSIKFLSGTFGTYVVKEKYGLDLIPTEITISSGASSYIGHRSSLLCGSDLEAKDRTYSHSIPDFDLYDGPRKLLVYGELVQVVYFESDIVKLARGRGYVQASNTQLVKVGPPTDRSCKIEGMLHMMTQEKIVMKKKVIELESLHSSLRQELKEAMEEPTEETPQIIQNRDETENLLDSPVPNRQAYLEEPPSPPVTPMTLPIERIPLLDDDDPMIIRTTRSDPEPHTLGTIAVSYASEESAGVPFREASNSTNLLTAKSTCGCNLSLLLPPEDDEADLMDSYQRGLIHTRRRRVEPTDHVDFRTGRSGHMALNSSYAPRRWKQRSEIRMMSEHKGIGTIRPIRQNIRGGTP